MDWTNDDDFDEDDFATDDEDDDEVSRPACGRTRLLVCWRLIVFADANTSICCAVLQEGSGDEEGEGDGDGDGDVHPADSGNE